MRADGSDVVELQRSADHRRTSNMSTASDDLTEVPDALFSEGIRSAGEPMRPTESHFAFADRVRQTYFERERRWYEDAFAHYPAGADRGDLRARFRSTDDFQHGAAAWELYVHELWRRLGWTLTPHPETPDGRRRDFLAERGDDRFILECAVDNASHQQAGAGRRWEELWAAFRSLACPTHCVMIHRKAIGADSLRAGSLVTEAQRNLDALAAGQSAIILRVETTDGWRFNIEASPGPLAGVVACTFGGGMSMAERLYNPIRNRVKDKSKRSSLLDMPFVLALQIVNPMPIVSKDGAVREALMGTQTQMLGFDLETTGLRPNSDGPWVQAGKPRGRGLSAVLLHQGMFLGSTLPILHHHPEPLRPLLTEDLPFDQVRYDITDTDVEAHQGAATQWHELFGLPPEWPGPDDPFEGINTDVPMPPPQFWSPNASDDEMAR